MRKRRTANKQGLNRRQRCLSVRGIATPQSRSLRFELLEDRRLLSADLASKAAFLSLSAGGQSGVVSANGRYVAFVSTTETLSNIAAAPGVQNVYRFDRTTGEVVLVSVNVAGTGSGNRTSDFPVISADGNVVAFWSTSSNLHPLDTNATSDIFARNLTTGTTYLVSINSAGAGGGNNVSQDAVISADGTVVAFYSSATDLQPLGLNGNGPNIFARNLATGTTSLVSMNTAGTGGGNGASTNPSISADGSVVAFSSQARNLHPLKTTSTNSDVFARNLTTNTTYLVSANSAGTGSGNSLSDSPVISADGSTVAFSSRASNLHALDTNTVADVFARNLVTGTTYLVSINSTGTAGGNAKSESPAISANGSVVAFHSAATDLHPLDTSSALDIFARNLVTGVTQLVSVSATGSEGGNSASVNPSISANGNVVAFSSFATNLHPLNLSSPLDVFARNLTTGVTHLVSVNSTGSATGNSFSGNEHISPAISADGTAVAFGSMASDLAAGDFNGQEDVFVRDLNTSITQLVSTFAADPSSVTGGDDSTVGTSVFSADGRYLAFVSRAANLVDGVNIAPNTQNVYRLDRLTGHVDLVSINVSGTGSGNSDSEDPVISADGSVVAFSSDAGNLVSLGGTGVVGNIYARNFTTGVTQLVSINLTGTAGGSNSSYTPVISADGTVVAFYSRSSNLHPLDTNGTSDIFARNLVTGTTLLVSVSSDGTAGGNAESTDPVLSANGRVVAFRSYASNLHSAKTTSAENDIFARNLETGTTYLVSINSAGSGSGNRDSFDAVISANGNVVAFRSSAVNLHPLKNSSSHYDVFARDLVAGVTLLVSVGSDGTVSGYSSSDDPAISADGSVVAFRSSASNLHPLDTNAVSDIFARNLNTGTTALVSVSWDNTQGGYSNSYDPVISADGSEVAFRSAAGNLNPYKNTGSYYDVFARNLVTGTTYLISTDANNTGSGNRNSNAPAISANGGVVAFDTDASNLVPGDYNSSSDVFAGTISGSQVSRGDYSQDGVVDSADYAMWRKALGSSVPNFTSADGDGDGVIGQGDYSVWRAHFGETALAAGSGASVGLRVVSGEGKFVSGVQAGVTLVVESSVGISVGETLAEPVAPDAASVDSIVVSNQPLATKAAARALSFVSPRANRPAHSFDAKDNVLLNWSVVYRSTARYDSDEPSDAALLGTSRDDGAELAVQESAFASTMKWKRAAFEEL